MHKETKLVCPIIDNFCQEGCVSANFCALAPPEHQPGVTPLRLVEAPTKDALEAVGRIMSADADSMRIAELENGLKDVIFALESVVMMNASLNPQAKEELKKYLSMAKRVHGGYDGRSD